jgi:hypothetical protein
MTTVIPFVPVVIVTLGSEPHVPLNLHQKILQVALVAPNSASAFQVCPLVSDIVSVTVPGVNR